MLQDLGTRLVKSAVIRLATKARRGLKLCQALCKQKLRNIRLATKARRGLKQIRGQSLQ